MALHSKLQHQSQRIYTRSATGLKQNACLPLHRADPQVSSAEHGFGPLQRPAVTQPGDDAEPQQVSGIRLISVAGHMPEFSAAQLFLPRGEVQPRTIKQRSSASYFKAFRKSKKDKTAQSFQNTRNWEEAQELKICHRHPK